MTSRWVALAPLLLLIHLTFGGYQLREGPPTAEVGIVDVNFAPKPLDATYDKETIIRSVIHPANLRYFVQQPQMLSRREIGRGYEDVAQINGAINFAINSLDLAKRDDRVLTVYFDTSPDVIAALSAALQVDLGSKRSFEFVNCRGCASKADLTIIALCKTGLAPCRGSIGHDQKGLAASDQMQWKPDWKALFSHTRTFTSDPPCWNRVEYLNSFAPHADTSEEASELAVGLTVSTPLGNQYKKQKEHFFKGNEPRNVGHESALLYVETWFPTPRCHPNMRYQAEKAIISNFYSLTIPSRTRGKTGFGSICVISGHQQSVTDHSKLAARCIQKWLDPMLSITERN